MKKLALIAALLFAPVAFAQIVVTSTAGGGVALGTPGPAGANGAPGPSCSVTSPPGTCDLGSTPFSARYINGVAAAPTATHTYVGINTFGDSTGAGGGSAAGGGWAAQVEAAVGGVIGHYPIGGDQAVDTGLKVMTDLMPTVSGNSVMVIEDFINDANYCGSAAGCLANGQHALANSVFYGAIPTAWKVMFGTNTTAVRTTGTWASTTIEQTNDALATSVNGTVTWDEYWPSTTHYVAWRAADGDTAAGSLSCVPFGGGSPVTLSGDSTTINSFGFNGQAIVTHNLHTQAVFANRYITATAMQLTCTITVTASTGKPFTMMWAAGGPSPQAAGFGQISTNPPTVFVSGVVRQQNGNLDSTTVLYDAITQTVANEAYLDGWYAYWVDARSAVSADVDMSGVDQTLGNGCVLRASTAPGLHPNGDICTLPSGQAVYIGGYADWTNAILKQMLPTGANTPGSGPSRNMTGNDSYQAADQTIATQCGATPCTYTLPSTTQSLAHRVWFEHFGGSAAVTISGGTLGLSITLPNVGDVAVVWNYQNSANWVGIYIPAAGSATASGCAQVVPTANYTMLKTDCEVYTNLSSGGGTITLPLTGNTYTQFANVWHNQGSGTVTVSGGIGFSATVPLGMVLELRGEANSTNWFGRFPGGVWSKTPAPLTDLNNVITASLNPGGAGTAATASTGTGGVMVETDTSSKTAGNLMVWSAAGAADGGPVPTGSSSFSFLTLSNGSLAASVTGQLGSLTPTIPAGMTVTAVEVVTGTAAVCTVYPTLNLRDTTAATNVATVTLASATNFYAMTVSGGTYAVPSSHQLRMYADFTGASCTTNPSNISMVATYHN